MSSYASTEASPPGVSFAIVFDILFLLTFNSLLGTLYSSWSINYCLLSFINLLFLFSLFGIVLRLAVLNCILIYSISFAFSRLKSSSSNY